MTDKDAKANNEKSIVPAKYLERMKGRAPDWIGEFITKNCTVSQDKNTVLSVPLMCELCNVNRVPEDKIDNFASETNVGRVRMSIGNMLRSRAKARHGLFNIDGKWSNAPEDFIGDLPKTQERDGTKIAKEKTKAAA